MRNFTIVMGKDVTLKSDIENFIDLPQDECHSSVGRYILSKCALLKHPDRPCITDPVTGDVLRYSHLGPLSAKVGTFLKQNGFGQGDVLVNVSHNGAKLHVFFVAVWRLGGIIQCIYPDEDAAALAERLEATGRAKFILCDEENEAKCFLALESRALSNVKVLVLGHVATKGISVEPLMNDSLADEWLDTPVEGNDIALLLPTSGTTGGSKSVVYTHQTLLKNILLFERFPFTNGNESGVTLITGKQTHFTGCVCPLAMFTTGRSLLMMKTVTQVNIFQAVQRYRVTSIFSFPTFLTGLVDHPNAPKYDLSSLEHVFTAGMVVGSKFVETVSKLRNVKHITSIYGMTEAGFLTSNVIWEIQKDSLTGSLDGKRDPTCGRLAPGGMLRVRCIETGEFLGPGQKGELCFKNDFVCTKYWKNPDESARTFNNGWIFTGDLGYYDTSGNVYILNRVKEVFKYFNNHITPSEIEEVISTHSHVRQACVVGVDDSEGGGGSVPRAFITLKESAVGVATKDQILCDVNDRLAPYKKLRGGLYIMTEFPCGKSGKVLRQALATFNPTG